MSFLKNVEVTIPTCGSILEKQKPIFALTINDRSCKATKMEIQKLDLHDFAVYLDVTSGNFSISLPGTYTKTQTVEEAGIDGVQDILGILLEHPHLNFGNVNIGLFLPHRAGMTPDAFRKAMAKIRRALNIRSANISLLLHFDRSHYSISETGHAWRISMEYGSLAFVKFLSNPRKFRGNRRP